MDRKNRLIWIVIGIVLFLACYVEAMTAFHR
jgi:uncharacterized protein YpmB